MSHASNSVLSSLAAGRRIGVSLLLTALALVVFVVPGAGARVQLEFDTPAVGPWWRLLSGHFAHWSAEHLFWDLLMFVLLASWCELRSRTWTLVCVLASAVTISVGVWMVQPELGTYRGLSGIDSALFVMLIVNLLSTAIRRRETNLALMLLLSVGVFCAKVIYEIASGQTLFVDARAAMVPVPLAHLLGGVVGALVAAAMRRRSPTTGSSKEADGAHASTPPEACHGCSRTHLA